MTTAIVDSKKIVVLVGSPVNGRLVTLPSTVSRSDGFVVKPVTGSYVFIGTLISINLSSPAFKEPMFPVSSTSEESNASGRST